MAKEQTEPWSVRHDRRRTEQNMKDRDILKAAMEFDEAEEIFD